MFSLEDAALAVCAAVVSLWQLGTGLYIPAKAFVAQVLLHNAWRRTLAGCLSVDVVEPKPGGEERILEFAG